MLWEASPLCFCRPTDANHPALLRKFTETGSSAVLAASVVWLDERSLWSGGVKPKGDLTSPLNFLTPTQRIISFAASGQEYNLPR